MKYVCLKGRQYIQFSFLLSLYLALWLKQLVHTKNFWPALNNIGLVLGNMNHFALNGHAFGEFDIYGIIESSGDSALRLGFIWISQGSADIPK